jgi:hypothetical protein
MRLASPLRLVLLLFSILFSSSLFVDAQIVLNADGPGNTYELINGFFAPGYNAVESPDQTSGTYPGTDAAFGRHIVEVFDAVANKFVFEFYSHVADDNDISTGKTDRQRVEIKTYAASPANMKGIIGETIVYKWKFKIPIGFQPSTYFTHIHQIKAVDGDDSDPIFTLTPRKGTPNKLELIYVLNSNSGTSKLAILNLSDFEGNWVEATETIKVGEGSTGTYAIIIKKVSDGSTLLNYSNNSIQTIRPVFSDPLISAANTFIRPKWGIYRGLTMPSDLRDESIRFSDFSITELSALAVQIGSFKAVKENNAVQLKWTTASEQNNFRFDIEKSTDGKTFFKIGSRDGFGNSNTANDYFFNDQNPSQGINYYRLKQIDFDGAERLINPIAINLNDLGFDMKVYSNLSSNSLSLFIHIKEGGIGQFLIYNLAGQKVFDQTISLNKGINDFIFPISLKSGVYISYFKNDKFLFPHQIIL